MAHSKNTILVLVVVILFALSGIVLYRGLFKGGASADVASISSIQESQREIVNLLPYGTTLNFNTVEKRSSTTNTVVYAPVDQTAVGVDIRALISPGSTQSSPTDVNPTQAR
jgi:hypothetical protein